MTGLVIIGAGEFAAIALEYFTHDSAYTVVACAVDHKYRQPGVDELGGVPIIDLHTIQAEFPPASFHAFVAIPATGLNTHRMQMCERVKQLGYTLATYVSSRAFVWKDVTIGENTFVFEGNVIQPFCEIGSGCILWSGNHVGHRTRIEDGVFIASHAVVSGYCVVGARSFLGVNCTIVDGIAVAAETVVGAGALIAKPTESGRVYGGTPARIVPGADSRNMEF